MPETFALFPREDVKFWLVKRIAKACDLKPSDIEIHERFSRYGLNSLDAVEISGDLEQFLGRRVCPTVTWQYPTIESLVNHLCGGEANSHGPAHPQ